MHGTGPGLKTKIGDWQGNAAGKPKRPTCVRLTCPCPTRPAVKSSLQRVGKIFARDGTAEGLFALSPHSQPRWLTVVQLILHREAKGWSGAGTDRRHDPCFCF
jgi:hypothetical protein